MRFSSLSASKQDIYSLSWFFSTIWLWTWETTVTSHNFSESSLTPFQFRSTLLFDTLNSMHGMLTRRGAVTLDLTWHLYHGNTLSIRATKVGYLETPYGVMSQNMPLQPQTRDEVINPVSFQRSWMICYKRPYCFGCH